MRTSLALLSLAGLSGLALALGQAPGSGDAPAAESPQTVTERLTLSTPFGEGNEDFHYIDLGKPGLGPGDQFTLVGLPVQNEATHQRIGFEDGLETILSGWHDGTVHQSLTFRFKGGTVAVAGNLRHTDQPIRLPVVGGTGEYTGVTGQLTEIREDAERKVSIFRLLLRH